jgi:hypothetical protein
VAITCDRTAINIGNEAGIIKLLESKPQYPLQWLICQLHANELLLRYFFEHLDGIVTGNKNL